MDRDPRIALGEVRAALVGAAVTYRRLAGNSLLVYFGCRPGDTAGYIVWLEPTWHFAGPGGVLAGSRQAQDSHDASNSNSGQKVAGRALDALMGLRLEALDVDDRTHDLTLRFERDFVLRTFVCDPTDDEIWYVRENTSNYTLRAAPLGLRTERIQLDP